MKKSTFAACLALGAITLVGVGCSHKTPVASTPPTPTAAPSAPQTTPQAPVQAQTPMRQEQPQAAPAQAQRMPTPAEQLRIDQLLAKIQDAYFDYDQHALRPDAVKALQADVGELRDIIKNYPDYKLTIEGHCDERGSAEYNVGLGEARAATAKEFLVSMGVAGDQLRTVSYGKEKPVCTEHDEDCWQKNRRAHFVALTAQR